MALSFQLPEPPVDYQSFVEKQTQEHIRKDHDYQGRFLKGINVYGRVIWEWEVDKKLDRIRTWVDRGELWVKGEGLNNAVGDLFNYTVQFFAHLDDLCNGRLVTPQLTQERFAEIANSNTPEEWVGILGLEGRIRRDETTLQYLVRYYMGDPLRPSEWMQTIQKRSS